LRYQEKKHFPATSRLLNNVWAMIKSAKRVGQPAPGFARTARQGRRKKSKKSKKRFRTP
jgi:hypothetical protein